MVIRCPRHGFPDLDKEESQKENKERNKDHLEKSTEKEHV